MLIKVIDVIGEILENKDNFGVINEMYWNVIEVIEKYWNVIEFLNLIQKVFNL